MLKYRDKLNDLLAATLTNTRTATSFTAKELEILEVYVDVTKPFAIAIQTLEGDINAAYGDLLPRLCTIETKLENIKNSAEQRKNNTKALATELLKCLRNRFVKEFSLDDGALKSICAAFSHPKYKNRWGSEEQCQKALTVFKSEFAKFDINSPSQPTESQEEEMNDYSVFIRPNPTQCTTRSEIESFFYDSRTELTMLNDYPVIKKMFLQFNTQLPTSASVERMFSFATLLDNSRRGSLTVENFEMCVLMKANANFGICDV